MKDNRQYIEQMNSARDYGSPLSEKAAAKFLGYSHKTFQTHKVWQQIPHVFFRGRRRYELADLRQFLSDNKVRSVEQVERAANN